MTFVLASTRTNGVRVLSKAGSSARLSLAPFAALSLVLIVAAPAPVLGQTYRVIHSFEGPVPMPWNRLLQTSSGTLYGVTQDGGRGWGTVFRVEADGTGHKVLHSFNSFDGRYPLGALVQGAGGTLYGTTSSTIFAIQPDGSGFRVLRDVGSNQELVRTSDGTLYGVNFDSIFRVQEDGSGFATVHGFSDGEQPSGPLTVGADGTLYGTTYYGGLYGRGTVFRLNGDGTGFSVLHSFGPWGFPQGGLVWLPEGVLLGTVNFGYGGIFRINVDGSGAALLHVFTLETGRGPESGLMLASDGLLYGTTVQGGTSPLSSSHGTIFRIAPDGGEFEVIHRFTGADGGRPRAGVIEGIDGLLYGCAMTDGSTGHGAFYRLAIDGSEFTTLLTPGSTAGDEPTSGLAQDTTGRLHGTTVSGGLGYGTLYSVDPDGSNFTTLHRFTNDDGARPLGTLAVLGDTLFGTASSGGQNGYGSVFTLAVDGSEFKVLHLFDGSDGAWPHGELVVGIDDALYGTTSGGGVWGRGTVFKISTSGEFVILHSFGPDEGYSPSPALILGIDGALYGVTDGQHGTVFRIEKDGNGFCTLHQFQAGEGFSPRARLSQVRTGTLFGTTTFGGTADAGTVFRINPDGSGFSTLHSFGHYEGALPQTGLTLGEDGWLYGATSFAGFVLDPALGERGILYRLKPDGSDFNALYPFRPMTGTRPWGDLLLGTDSVFYGTTTMQGPSGGGVVFSWTRGTTADVAIDVQASTEIALVGSLVDFKMTITNPGPDDASGLIVRNELPAGLTFQRGSSECANFPQWGVACGIPFLEKGTSNSLTLQFAVTNPGEITSNFSLSDDTADFNEENNIATAVIRAIDGGVFRLAGATSATSETGYVNVTVERDLGTGTAAVRYRTYGSTAQPTSDFSPVSGTLSFGKGVTSRSISIPIRADCQDEGDEDFQVVLSRPSANAMLGPTTTTTITIHDNDDPGQIRFDSASYSNEEAGRAKITVTRVPLTPGARLACGVGVRYATSDGTARVSEDYAQRSRVLHFGANVAARSFFVPIVVDRRIESDENVILTLSSPSGGVQLGVPSTASLAIVNDDLAGTFELRLAAVEAKEGTIAAITVIRTGGIGGIATVDYTTLGGTAQAGSDYSALIGTLTFRPGVVSRTFQLPILSDGLEEGDETIGLVLSSPTAGGSLGGQATATVTIVRNTT